VPFSRAGNLRVFDDAGVVAVRAALAEIGHRSAGPV
jgi:hypothetical protein